MGRRESARTATDRRLSAVELPGAVRAGGAKDRAQGPLYRRHGTDAAVDHTTARLLHAVQQTREHHTAAQGPSGVAVRDDGQADHDRLFVSAGVRRPRKELQAGRLVRKTGG